MLELRGTEKSFLKEKLQVVVVEDNLELKTILEKMLRKLHPTIEVLWFNRADYALDVLSEKEVCTNDRVLDRIDLCIVDIYTEGEMAGTELVNSLLLDRPSLPVVMMSSLKEEEFRRMSRLMGCVHEVFIEKPFYPLHFLERLRQTLFI